MVNSIGGIKRLKMEGDVLLAGKRITVFSVEEEDLPPQTPILLGVPHILALSVSLDFALSHPGCELEDAMSLNVPPVFSRSDDPRKEEQTVLFSPPPSDTLAVSSFVFCAAILVSLLGLTWRLKGESSHLMSPLTLVSLSVLWGTVFVGLLSLVGVKSDTSTSGTFLRAPDITGTDWKRGRNSSPLQTNESERAAGRLSSLPRPEGIPGPHARARLCFRSPPSSTSSLQREISFARRGERPSLMEKARLRPRPIRALRSKARSPWRFRACCTLW